MQIGVFARRNPDGSFMPARPIYRYMTEKEAQKAKENMLNGLKELAIRHFYGTEALWGRKEEADTGEQEEGEAYE